MPANRARRSRPSTCRCECVPSSLHLFVRKMHNRGGWNGVTLSLLLPAACDCRQHYYHSMKCVERDRAACPPALAHLFIRPSHQAPMVDLLQGLAIGNGLTDPAIQYGAYR